MGSLNWKGPFQKFKDRASSICGRDASVSLDVFTYNANAVPVTQYQALPTEFNQLERVAMQTIPRLSQNALRHPDFFQLGDPCGIKISSLSASCASAVFRTARSTILSSQRYHCGARSSEIWDTPLTALCLREACLGFPSDGRWKEGATNVIHELETLCPSKGEACVCFPGDACVCFLV